jgi:hypothetical protein
MMDIIPQKLVALHNGEELLRQKAHSMIADDEVSTIPAIGVRRSFFARKRHRTRGGPERPARDRPWIPQVAGGVRDPKQGLNSGRSFVPIIKIR